MATSTALSAACEVAFSAGLLAALPVSLLPLCPGIAALLTGLLCHRPLSQIGWRPGRPQYWLVGYLIPMLYAWLGYSAVWLTGRGRLAPQHLIHAFDGVRPLAALPTWGQLAVTYGITITLITVLHLEGGLGEEMGWRGLLVPELMQITNFTNTALVSGIVWAVWHYPLIFFAGYHGATPLWYSTLCFTALIVGLSFILAWLRLKSGSVWPVALLHAVHKAVIQAYLTPLTADTGQTWYFIDEFGVALLPFVGLLAYAIWWHATVAGVQPGRGADQALG